MSRLGTSQAVYIGAYALALSCMVSKRVTIASSWDVTWFSSLFNRFVSLD